MEDKVLKKREEIREEDKWLVNEIYSSDEVWEKEFEELKTEAPKLKEFQGKLGSGEKLLEYFEVNEKISRKAEKIYVYAHLRSDEDTANTKYQSMMNRIDAYMAEYATYSAYFVPEILSLEDGFVEKEIERLDGLKEYKFLLENILKEKPHVLSEKEEELLAAASDCLDAPSSIHNIMTNADMKFGDIKDEEGHTVELTEGNYSSFIRSKDRAVRKAAFEGLFKEYKAFENTLATTLSSSIKTFNFGAKIRNYNSALEASLKPNDIPVEVYTNAIKTIDENLSSLHRYVSLKKRLLGLDEMHMYDSYVPVIELDKEHIEFDKAVEMIIEGLAPLGKEYLDIFTEGIKAGWVDKYMNKGKRGGAYSSGSFLTNPFILMNFEGKLNDVSTLAHELGHSMHSYFSIKNNSYKNSNYQIFVAEIASTVNEMLLANYLLKESDEKTKILVLNNLLDLFKATIYRQTMFAEFEKKMVLDSKNGIILTSDYLCDNYYKLVKEYFGDNVIIDKEIQNEWARIPHFYYDFYVYKYATGLSIASYIATEIFKGNQEMLKNYREFLKIGGRMNPRESLMTLGIDITKKDVVLNAIKLFDSYIEEFNTYISK